jgi:hypothetical protein
VHPTRGHLTFACDETKQVNKRINNKQDLPAGLFWEVFLVVGISTRLLGLRVIFIAWMGALIQASLLCNDIAPSL